MDDIELNNLYKLVIDNAMVGIGLTDLEGRFILVNEAWCRKMGYNQNYALMLSVKDITMPEDLEISNLNFKKLAGGEVDSIEKLTRYKRKDGTSFYANLSVSSVKDDNGKIIAILGIFNEVNDQLKIETNLRDDNQALEAVNERLKLANEEINKKNAELETAYVKLDEMARTDTLTNLPNRRQLEDQLLMESMRTMRTQRDFSVCIADIDDFKCINDNYGHDIGDIVLKDIANIFKQNTRSVDYIGRWGGEEFMFILPETPVTGAFVLMERVRLSVLNHIVQKGDIRFSVTVTLGFSSFGPESSLEDVLKQADLAMYAGKKRGKNIAVKYDKRLETVHSIN